jgi:hypothetical protein
LTGFIRLKALLTFQLSNLSTDLSTGGEIRTPINGFGDRYSAIELRPYHLLSLNADEASLVCILTGFAASGLRPFFKLRAVSHELRAKA